MRRFKAQLWWRFFAGHVDDGRTTEDVPDDLLGADGVVIEPIAWWPREPFEVVAVDRDGAHREAERRAQARDNTIFLDSRVKQATFDKYCERQRPGCPPELKSVAGEWQIDPAEE
jgi:hypothetical protein